MKRRQWPESVLVAFSGGKDSQVVLDRCRRFVPRVEAFFWYLVEGLECQERFLRVEEAKGLKIHRIPRPEMVDALRFGHLRMHYTEAEKLPRFRYVDIEAIARHRSGIDWIAYGHRMSDSLERRGMLNKIRGYDEKHKRTYPLWDWSTDQVRRYLRHNRLPSPQVVGGNRMGDVSFNEESLRYLRDHWPSDYEKFLKVFPFADAVLFRAEEMREKAWKEKEDPPPAAQDGEQKADPHEESGGTDQPEV